MSSGLMVISEVVSWEWVRVVRMRRVYCGRRGGGDQLPVTRDDEKRVRTCGVFPSSGSSLGDPSATPYSSPLHTPRRASPCRCGWRGCGCVHVTSRRLTASCSVVLLARRSSNVKS
ncbi:uncharacterized protein LOC135107286 isoform X1 [Scylla paramamosain]|uniref:uncharacterized protein LOC135107286 isoform X1 n=1 Tax=Scylla paramamosain TaxID=85552 RepID=UPI0030836B19